MDALMALVVAAFAQCGDRTAWLAAILADRYRRPGLIILAAAIALFAASGIAAAGGAMLAPLLTPNARLLMLGLALILQGAGAMLKVTAPDPLRTWNIGPIATTTLGLFILAFGDGLQFIILTLAARTAVPALAAIGATIGSLAVIIPAVLLGAAAWQRLPLAQIRRVAGGIFLVIGIIIGLNALRLI
jgi:putative Ca2+/H+ antiporter (TMEM165/GDT1 family)